MPKVIPLTRVGRFRNSLDNIGDRCDDFCRQKKIKKSELAEFLDKSPQAVYKQFESGRITTELLLAIIAIGNPTADDLERMVSIK